MLITAKVVYMIHSSYRHIILTFSVALCAGLFVTDRSVHADTLYVWTNSPSPAVPYTNWTMAARTIQDAVNISSSGDVIQVRSGVYRTGGITNFPMGYNLTNRLVIYQPVVVRGVDGPEVTVIEGTGPIGDRAARCVFLVNNAVLDGFTLSNGHTQGWSDYDGDGGGIMCQSSAATVTNCIIQWNEANRYGGGARGGTYYNCKIYNNEAGGNGGGAVVGSYINCVFSNNVSGSTGGGGYQVYMSGCDVVDNLAVAAGGVGYSTVTNCTIWENQANVGGAVQGCTVSYSLISSNRADMGGGAEKCTLYYCTLMGNQSMLWGGGVMNCGGVHYSYKVENSVFYQNKSQFGGAAYDSTLLNCSLMDNYALYGGGIYEAILTNSIVYHNKAFISGDNYYLGWMDYCCTYPGPASGVGNITGDPGLAALDNPHICSNSPCINAGGTAYAVGTYDIDGESRIVGGAVDIGCDEYYGPGITGALSVAVSSDCVIVMPGEPVILEAVIQGKVDHFEWDWKDGFYDPDETVVQHTYSSTGDRNVTLTAWNNNGSASGMITVYVVSYTNTYVSSGGSQAWPYSSWATAAHDIQSAVDATPAGGRVSVAPGSYNSGSRTMYGMPHRLVVTRPITLSATSGDPSLTVIQGAAPIGPSAARCAYLGEGCRVEGFTFSGGATHTNAYDYLMTWNDAWCGGVVCEDGVSLTNCIVSGNSAAYNCGGILGGELWDCIITNNRAYMLGGGSYGSKLHDCLVIGNSARYGGGLCDGEIYDSLITKNTAIRDGGGAFAKISTLVDGTVTYEKTYITNSVLADNLASNDAGAAAYCTIHNSRIINNEATRYGGGAYVCPLYHCWVEGNRAEEKGGGIYGSFTTSMYCVVVGNTAYQYGYGGGIYGGDVINCTVLCNTSFWGGGGCDYVYVSNSIIMYNIVTDGDPKYNNYFSTYYLGYSCTTPFIDDPDVWDHDTTNDPQFVNWMGGDYRLSSASPCIDTGGTNITNAVDYSGIAGPLDGDNDGQAVIDMGAYEYASSVADTDGDSMVDSHEVLAGTSPIDSDSFLGVRQCSVVSGAGSNGLVVSWSSEPGKYYSLDRSSNLMSVAGFPTSVASNILATPPTNTWTDTSAVGDGPWLYRVRLE